MEINPETLEIEIVDVEPIEGGVQVFARAWSDGEQIGFGADGTVDIERFRIFNPPILVPDENGDIIQEQLADEERNIPYSYRVLREDAEMATIQSLAHTIQTMKNIHGSINMIPEKRGNTTSTFYPDAGTGGTTVDGAVIRNGVNETWATKRAGAGNGAQPTLTSLNFGLRISTGDSAQGRNLERLAATFDTSAIPDGDTISSATYSLYVNSKTATVPVSYRVVSVTLAANNNLVNADYAVANWGSTGYNTDVTIASITATSYNNFVLNSTGIAAISKTGVTALGARTDMDADNSFPAGGVYATGAEGLINVTMADNTGTTQDPKLVVEHAAAVLFRPRIIMY
jgi:hypothetical protein